MLYLLKGADESQHAVAYETLQNKFALIYMNMEPRDIADEMLQDGLITVAQHDGVADFSNKYQRLVELFRIMKSKQSHSTFWVMVDLVEKNTGCTSIFKECKSFLRFILHKNLHL